MQINISIVLAPPFSCIVHPPRAAAVRVIVSHLTFEEDDRLEREKGTGGQMS
jgi:hypothetical protein